MLMVLSVFRESHSSLPAMQRRRQQPHQHGDTQWRVNESGTTTAKKHQRRKTSPVSLDDWKKMSWEAVWYSLPVIEVAATGRMVAAPIGEWPGRDFWSNVPYLTHVFTPWTCLSLILPSSTHPRMRQACMRSASKILPMLQLWQTTASMVSVPPYLKQ